MRVLLKCQYIRFCLCKLHLDLNAIELFFVLIWNFKFSSTSFLQTLLQMFYILIFPIIKCFDYIKLKKILVIQMIHFSSPYSVPNSNIKFSCHHFFHLACKVSNDFEDKVKFVKFSNFRDIPWNSRIFSNQLQKLTNILFTRFFFYVNLISFQLKTWHLLFELLNWSIRFI